MDINTLNLHKNSKTYHINTNSFKNILHLHNIAYIDILSIDVQGAEYIVLTSKK